MISSLPNQCSRQAAVFSSSPIRLPVRPRDHIQLQYVSAAPHRAHVRRPANVTSLLSLPVLAAFALFTSPARAMPAASMQLFRLDNRGVRAVPAISDALAAHALAANSASTSKQAKALSQVQPAEAARASIGGNPAIWAATTSIGAASAQANQGLEIAQADTSLSDPKVLDVTSDNTVVVNPQGDPLTASVDPNSLSIRFNSPIPTDIQGEITVRVINSDNTLGEVQQLISNYTVSPDGLSITLKPGSNIPAGTKFAFQFPTTCAQGPCVYPGQSLGQPLYVGFSSSQVIGPAIAAAAAAAFPVWAVVLGVVVVGVGVAAASGAFSSGDGGTNPSSQ